MEDNVKVTMGDVSKPSGVEQSIDMNNNGVSIEPHSLSRLDVQSLSPPPPAPGIYSDLEKIHNLKHDYNKEQIQREMERCQSKMEMFDLLHKDNAEWDRSKEEFEIVRHWGLDGPRKKSFDALTAENASVNVARNTEVQLISQSGTAEVDGESGIFCQEEERLSTSETKADGPVKDTKPVLSSLPGKGPEDLIGCTGGNDKDIKNVNGNKLDIDHNDCNKVPKQNVPQNVSASNPRRIELAPITRLSQEQKFRAARAEFAAPIKKKKPKKTTSLKPKNKTCFDSKTTMGDVTKWVKDSIDMNSKGLAIDPRIGSPSWDVQSFTPPPSNEVLEKNGNNRVISPKDERVISNSLSAGVSVSRSTSLGRTSSSRRDSSLSISGSRVRSTTAASPTVKSKDKTVLPNTSDSSRVSHSRITVRTPSNIRESSLSIKLKDSKEKIIKSKESSTVKTTKPKKIDKSKVKESKVPNVPHDKKGFVNEKAKKQPEKEAVANEKMASTLKTTKPKKVDEKLKFPNVPKDKKGLVNGKAKKQPEKEPVANVKVASTLKTTKPKEVIKDVKVSNCVIKDKNGRYSTKSKALPSSTPKPKKMSGEKGDTNDGRVKDKIIVQDGPDAGGEQISGRHSQSLRSTKCRTPVVNTGLTSPARQRSKVGQEPKVPNLAHNKNGLVKDKPCPSSGGNRVLSSTTTKTKRLPDEKGNTNLVKSEDRKVLPIKSYAGKEMILVNRSQSLKRISSKTKDSSLPTTGSKQTMVKAETTSKSKVLTTTKPKPKKQLEDNEEGKATIERSKDRKGLPSCNVPAGGRVSVSSTRSLSMCSSRTKDSSSPAIYSKKAMVSTETSPPPKNAQSKKVGRETKVFNAIEGNKSPTKEGQCTSGRLSLRASMSNSKELPEPKVKVAKAKKERAQLDEPIINRDKKPKLKVVPDINESNKVAKKNRVLSEEDRMSTKHSRSMVINTETSEVPSLPMIDNDAPLVNPHLPYYATKFEKPNRQRKNLEAPKFPSLAEHKPIIMSNMVQVEEEENIPKSCGTWYPKNRRSPIQPKNLEPPKNSKSPENIAIVRRTPPICPLPTRNSASLFLQKEKEKHALQILLRRRL